MVTILGLDLNSASCPSPFLLSFLTSACYEKLCPPITPKSTVMIKTLLLLVSSCIRFSLQILRIAIIKAFLPRMPLPNWRKEVVVSNRRIRKHGKRASTGGPGRSLADSFVPTNDHKEATRFKIPKSLTVPVDKVIVTPTKPAVVEFEFSIYTDPAPQDTHYLLTPLRPPPIKEVTFTLLKNASERVSEILRENRRRLDAGEDPSTVRKEARRKRAMELSAARRGRAKLLSYVT
ncbi:hypothetical protein BYT27DRAFT_7240930 [Phlegmacium glaucopus]|nr:hypothetical protein BYT27DRAFT_7240930 [Phlegmacium glaucopus]